MVKRYEFTCHDSDPDAVIINHGRYVLYSDYAELAAENERLKIEIGECKLVIEQQDRDAEAAASRIATLKAENEQLHAQLVKATDPAYLEEKLRQIGITDEIAERALEDGGRHD